MLLLGALGVPVVDMVALERLWLVEGELEVSGSSLKMGYSANVRDI